MVYIFQYKHLLEHPIQHKIFKAIQALLLVLLHST